MNAADKIRALGTIEGYKSEIQSLDARLAALDLWLPATALRKECHEALRRIEDVSARFDRKLTVTIIGPGGAGKSTLFNAMAAEDELSATGKSRPTTEKVVVVCEEMHDADGIEQALGGENVVVKLAPRHPLLEHAILVDTPDTDSTAQAAHVPLVQRAVESSDVLLCVFNAENPKTRDHVDFFAAFIPYFQGGALIGILNKCDRIDEDELKKAIVPEFERYIRDAWGRPLQSLYCISARRHLQRPDWDENAPPRHGFDQFDAFQTAVSVRFNQAAQTADRVDVARHLRDFIVREVRTQAAANAAKLAEVMGQAAGTERTALKAAFKTLQEEDSGQPLGVSVLLYQRLANQWTGPVGWMIAVWARILIFGTGLMAVFRFGNPLRQLMGIVSSLRHFKDARGHVQDARKDERVGAAMRAYRVAIMKSWPDISEKMVQNGFDGTVRNAGRMLLPDEEMDETLSSVWQAALGTTLAKRARTFSHFILQLVFNLPILALLAHIGWLTARRYLSGDYLSSDFFLHAFLTAAIVLLLSFFLFQGVLRLFAGPERIVRNAFRQIQQDMGPFQRLSANSLFQQLETVVELSRENNGNTS